MEKITLYYALSPSKNSEELLKSAAEHYSEIPASSFDVHRERGKKPYFEGHPELHFSVSHSENIWICTFAPCEIGCDIQLHKEIPRYKKLSERWFHPSEAEKIACEQDFYDVWSRKEAFVKAVGCGIDENFKKFDTISGMAELGGISLKLTDFRLPAVIPREYSACVAYDDIVEIEFIDIKKTEA